MAVIDGDNNANHLIGNNLLGTDENDTITAFAGYDAVMAGPALIGATTRLSPPC